MNFSEYNFDKFKKELIYCSEKVPFYKKKLSSMNVNPNDIQSPRDIIKLPYTMKKDYRKNFPMGVLAEGFSLNEEILTRSQSSGTTGDRLVTYEVGMLLLARAMNCADINENIESAFMEINRKVCRYAAPNCSDVECANPNSTMEDRLLPDGTLVLPVYHDLLTTSDELISRAIDEILSFKPDLYYVDPTHFAFLVKQFKKRGIEPHPAPVVATYSSATQVSRRQIAEYFPMSTAFAELMASSEMGWIGLECPQGRLHLNNSSFFFEFILNEQYTKTGEIGEMAITSLDNGAIPHMRYRTGDAFRLLEEPCPCGHDSQCVIMEGRLDNFIKRNNQLFLSPHDIDDLVGGPEWLDMYQLHQQDENNFALKLIVNECYQPDDEDYIVDTLKSTMQEKINLAVSKVDYIPSQRSGKFQFVISDVRIQNNSTGA